MANSIKENAITKETKKNYYLVASLLATIATYIASIYGVEDKMVTLSESIVIVTITIIGINVTFKTNGENDSSDYVSRMVMLGLPIFIKIVAFTFLVGIFAGIFSASDKEMYVTIFVPKISPSTTLLLR